MTDHVEQPLPVATDGPHIHDLAAADVRQTWNEGAWQVGHDLAGRKRIGVARYGQPLQAHNGRDALRDAYEEALDLIAYLKQAQQEQGLEFGVYRDAIGVACGLAVLLRPRADTEGES